MPFSKEKKERPKKEKPKKEKSKDRFLITREKIGVITHGSGVYIIKDEATGISYLVINDGGIAVTPLLGVDGKPITDLVETDLVD